MKFLILNGPNLNLLGKREPDVYGSKSYADLLEFIQTSATDLEVEVECGQTNHEGVLVDWIQASQGVFDGIIINPAAYTHTSIAIMDALQAVGLPAVEVHLSDTRKRESFRHTSYAGLVCVKTFQGLGFEGYRQAMEWLKQYLTHRAGKGLGVEVRAYRDADWPHLQRIHNAARLQELTLCGYMAGYADLQTTYEAEKLFDGEVIVLTYEATPRGFIAYKDQEITWLYVEPGFQRQGFAKELLYYALQHSKRPLSVWVLHGNLPAIALYRAMGFVFMEEKKGQLICPGRESVPAIGLRYTLLG